MKITKIKIQNYRLLKSLEVKLEDDLSLIIGKNNSGKTSLLTIMEKFIGSKSSLNDFSCDDFNIEFQKELKTLIDSEEELANACLGISLKLFIEYNERDDLSNISKVMMDLDPDNKTIVLAFEYVLTKESFSEFKSGYKTFAAARNILLQEPLAETVTKVGAEAVGETKAVALGLAVESVSETSVETLAQTAALEIPAGIKINGDLKLKPKDCFFEFLREEHHKYFKVFKKTIEFDVSTKQEIDSSFIDLDKQKEKINLDTILNFKIISAKRNVSNKESDKTLSLMSYKYYEKQEGEQAVAEELKTFKETLTRTDHELDKVYDNLFTKVIKKVERFGGIKKGDSLIKIISSLHQRNLLQGNTTVMYNHSDDHSLPENYNGLGYMNLISMIFEIEVIISDFRKKNRENEKPSDINLLFIEEPEAHTHPQMQYVFINNIKSILKEASEEPGENKFNLQSIITTHSSHITAQSKFDDIKYFYRKSKNEVIAKSLKDLQGLYEADGDQGKKNFKFLKQYLTLHRAELFFADKGIFIEGDTERILLPAMLKKIDQDNPGNPLLSQNISIIEVGAYSHIFEKFIDFIGIKSLIITDIDAVKSEPVLKNGEVQKLKDGTDKRAFEACRVADGSKSSNAAINFFFKEVDFEKLKTLPADQKIFSKANNTWEVSTDGKTFISYQTSIGGYQARSFEDSFLSIANNRTFIKNSLDYFEDGIKNADLFDDAQVDAYDLSEKCIKSKSSFAIEILLNSTADATGKQFSDWDIPEYIKEGLIWLQQD